MTQPSCPRCNSQRTVKDGLNKCGNQRLLCKDCANRFSVGHNNLRTNHATSSDRLVCVLKERTKNMTFPTETLKSVGDVATRPDQATNKGLLLQYSLWLQKEGYGEDSRYISCIRMLMNSGCNLLDPEDVKATIAKKSWKNGTKMQASYAYDAMTKMLKTTWTMPKYTQEEILPFIPDEKELDALVAGSQSPRMTAYLQTLKETMADPTEALRLRWIDISGNIVSINAPVKGHRPRQLQVSNKLLAMLQVLPHTSERIFQTNYRSLACCYKQLRKRVAHNLQNPRLLKITFVTFRHWGATMLYHYSRGNILLVKKLLGHKNINSTMKYTQLIEFHDDDYDVATAATVEEAKSTIATGYEFVVEKNGIMLFRRPKRFGSYTT